jgi:hypothetical protein
VWAVGIIRRLLAQDSAQYYVGIELLGRGVQLVDLSKRGGREMSGTALLLPSHIGDSLAQAELNLLLPRGAFLPDEPLEMSVYDTTYSITPLMVLEAGDGFEIGRFRINDRAA